MNILPIKYLAEWIYNLQVRGICWCMWYHSHVMLLVGQVACKCTIGSYCSLVIFSSFCIIHRSKSKLIIYKILTFRKIIIQRVRNYHYWLTMYNTEWKTITCRIQEVVYIHTRFPRITKKFTLNQIFTFRTRSTKRYVHVELFFARLLAGRFQFCGQLEDLGFQHFILARHLRVVELQMFLIANDLGLFVQPLFPFLFQPFEGSVALLLRGTQHGFKHFELRRMIWTRKGLFTLF